MNEKTSINYLHLPCGYKFDQKTNRSEDEILFWKLRKKVLFMLVCFAVFVKQLQNVGEPEISGTEQECGAEEIQTGSPGSRGKHQGKTGQ